jgi:predicted peptidase
MRIAALSSLIFLSVAALAAPSVLAQTTTQAAEKGKAKATTPVAGSYKTEAEAQQTCPGAAVVWVNTRSKIYHAKGTAPYGKTKSGFYMCQALADTSGFRAVRASTPKKSKTKGTEKS